jgi:hypothetical protein
MFLVNPATKSAGLFAVINNSPFDHMIVPIVDCVEDEAGIGQGCEENEKQQGKLHCDIEMCFCVFVSETKQGNERTRKISVVVQSM